MVKLEGLPPKNHALRTHQVHKYLLTQPCCDSSMKTKKIPPSIFPKSWILFFEKSQIRAVQENGKFPISAMRNFWKTPRSPPMRSGLLIGAFPTMQITKVDSRNATPHLPTHRQMNSQNDGRWEPSPLKLQEARSRLAGWLVNRTIFKNWRYRRGTKR